MGGPNRMTVVYAVAAGMVISGTIAMSLHKLASCPVLEIVFWALAIGCFALLEILLHHPLQ